jgi:hypothetical protein
MQPLQLARNQALGRIGIGITMVVRPQLGTGPWVGADARSPGAQVVTRALGAREIALGIGQLGALRNGNVRPWLVGGMIADGVDLFATIKARDDIPATGFAGVSALAAGSALLCAFLARGLD